MNSLLTTARRKTLRTQVVMVVLGCWLVAASVRTLPAQPPSASSAPHMTAADRKALQTALDAYDQGNAKAAEPVLRDLARRYPGSYEANEALGSLYVESGAETQALPYLEHACAIAPRQAIAHANLGAAYLKLNRTADAVRELQKAAVLEPKNGATQSNLGQALMQANQPAAAAKAFAIASAAAPEDWTLRYNWALALFTAGSTEQSGTVLAKIPAAAMTDQAHALAGDVEEKLGHFKEAVLHYQAAAQMNPSEANLYTLTVEFLRHWTWDEALQIANYGASRYPAATRFKVAAGIALYGNSKYPAAVQALAPLLASDPDNALYADLLGRSCSLIAEGESADCNGLEEFARRHPDNARAALYAATGILHRPAAEQDTAKVEQFLNQAIAADPKLAQAYYQLGVLEQQRSQWKQSAVVLEKAIALRPAYPEAHYRLSRAYSHLGMREQAQQQMALQQQYSQQEKDNLNARMQEVVTFLLKTN